MSRERVEFTMPATVLRPLVVNQDPNVSCLRTVSRHWGLLEGHKEGVGSLSPSWSLECSCPISNMKVVIVLTEPSR